MKAYYLQAKPPPTPQLSLWWNHSDWEGDRKGDGTLLLFNLANPTLSTFCWWRRLTSWRTRSHRACALLSPAHVVGGGRVSLKVLAPFIVAEWSVLMPSRIIMQQRVCQILLAAFVASSLQGVKKVWCATSDDVFKNWMSLMFYISFLCDPERFPCSLWILIFSYVTWGSYSFSYLFIGLSEGQLR